MIADVVDRDVRDVPVAEPAIVAVGKAPYLLLSA
jgi:hypothetical protein